MGGNELAAFYESSSLQGILQENTCPSGPTAWREACRKVGVDAHLHDLRHHAATLIARKPGVTTRELMVHLGHSSPRAALIYQHATEERDREIAEWQDNVIAEAKRRANEKKRAPVAKLPKRSAKGS
jgi:hypothetical protein